MTRSAGNPRILIVSIASTMSSTVIPEFFQTVQRAKLKSLLIHVLGIRLSSAKAWKPKLFKPCFPPDGIQPCRTILRVRHSPRISMPVKRPVPRRSGKAAGGKTDLPYVGASTRVHPEPI